MLRHALLVALACIVTLFIAGCNKSNTPGPPTQTTVDQVLKQIAILQSAIVAESTPDASGQQLIPSAAAAPILSFLQSATVTIQASPNGWKTAVITAWGQAKLKIPALSLPAVHTYIIVVDVLLASA